jgi:5'-nucleotidase / UDP-sugar diphosphatase
MPSTLVYADNGERIVTGHPAPLNQAPPPTLAPPTPTTKPTEAPATPTAVLTPTAIPTPAPRTYTVQRGDELKHIAAQYGVTIWQIIDTNDIPNPDSLRVGQVLQIPDGSAH